MPNFLVWGSQKSSCKIWNFCWMSSDCLILIFKLLLNLSDILGLVYLLFRRCKMKKKQHTKLSWCETAEHLLWGYFGVCSFPSQTEPFNFLRSHVCGIRTENSGCFWLVNRELSGLSTNSDMLHRSLLAETYTEPSVAGFTKVMLVVARPGQVSSYFTILTGVTFHEGSQSERQHACKSYPDVSVKLCACLRTRWSFPYLSILIKLWLSYRWRVIFSFVSKSHLNKIISNFQSNVLQNLKAFSKVWWFSNYCILKWYYHITSCELILSLSRYVP